MYAQFCCSCTRKNPEYKIGSKQKPPYTRVLYDYSTLNNLSL